MEAIIENGVARDILKAGLASLQVAPNPKDEVFVLDDEQARLIVGLLGRQALKARGLL